MGPTLAWQTFLLLICLSSSRSRFEGHLEASDGLFGCDSLTGLLQAMVMQGTVVAVNSHVGAMQMAGPGHTETAE